MKLRNVKLLMFLSLALSSSSAFAGFSVSLLGSGNYEISSAAQGGFGSGFGGLLEYRAGVIGLESGFIYQMRNLNNFGRGIANYGDIPLVIRVHVGRAFSLGVGAAYELPMTTGALVYWAATADMRFRASLGKSVGVFFEPRFTYDVTHTGNTQLNFISGIVGLQIGM